LIHCQDTVRWAKLAFAPTMLESIERLDDDYRTKNTMRRRSCI
jgi:hypothetical protein